MDLSMFLTVNIARSDSEERRHLPCKKGTGLFIRYYNNPTSTPTKNKQFN